MKGVPIKTLAPLIVAILVISAGAWYSRSAKQTVSPVNVAVEQPTERKCSNQTLADQVDTANLILTGEVFVVLPDEPDALVYMKPLTVYKGTAPTPLIIRAEEAAEMSDATTQQQVVVLPNGSKESELHFASGQSPYLLFLRKSDNKFLTSRCDGSRLLGAGLTDEEQAALSR